MSNPCLILSYLFVSFDLYLGLLFLVLEASWVRLPKANIISAQPRDFDNWQRTKSLLQFRSYGLCNLVTTTEQVFGGQDRIDSLFPYQHALLLHLLLQKSFWFQFLCVLQVLTAYLYLQHSCSENHLPVKNMDSKVVILTIPISNNPNQEMYLILLFIHHGFFQRILNFCLERY